MKGFIDKQTFISLLKDNMTMMVGGFLANGSPEKLIDLVAESGVTNITLICNDGGFPDKGVGKLIETRRVRKLIASHIGTNPTVGNLMQSGELEVELVPQGTLAERIHAGGAGLGGILTPTGLNTIVEKDKQIITLDGISYLLETPLTADLSLIGGAVADRYGNLRYIQTMRNFNPIIALAAECVVAESMFVEDEIDPENVITPHPLVDYILTEAIEDGR
jgi:acetate CoA/acetoacetate CoA-transferase alpha subunit